MSNYNTLVELDERQLAAVLAGLRLYQAYPWVVPDDDVIIDIATNNHEFEALTDEEVDGLIQEINGLGSEVEKSGS